MMIEGIGIAGYRSFGSQLQLIGPFAKVNLFIGRNNCGKSNILRYLSEHYATACRSANGQEQLTTLNAIDRHKGEDFRRIELAFGMQLGGTSLQRFHLDLKEKLDGTAIKLIERILTSDEITHGTDLSWFRYQATWEQSVGGLSIGADTIRKIADDKSGINTSEWRLIWGKLLGGSGGDWKRYWIPGTLKLLSPARYEPPRILLIPAIRKVAEAETEDSGNDDFSGLGIIDRLARLQNPQHDQQDDKDRFERINEFLKNVTEDPEVELEIPYARNTILVHKDDRVLPLESLGTGLHEIVILAAAATIHEEHVICIEEPEIHMHPSLQKKLIEYLQNETSNQYFIATHSAHILDCPDVAIFHVRNRRGHTHVEFVQSSTERSSVCTDLGYRPSDLLQANCIIWVEGPSDRIYLNHWLSTIDPRLIEGVHYSIMFYGGRLQSHLTALDPEALESEIEDFISLRRLNRHISIVIDSDRAQPGERLNATKQRLRKEFDKGPGFAWITAGREIENYVHPDLLLGAIRGAHKNASHLVSTDKHSHPYYYVDDSDKVVERINKVKVALEVAKRQANLGVHDLQSKINKLVKFITESNGLD